MSMVTQYTFTFFSAFGLAFYLSWKLTLVIIAGIPLVFILIPLVSSRIQPNIVSQAEKLGQAAKLTMSAFSSIETVKCYNGEEPELKMYSSIIMEAANCFFRQAFWNGLQAFMLRLVTLCMFVQGFWFGNYMFGKGEVTASEIMTAFWASIMGI